MRSIFRRLWLLGLGLLVAGPLAAQPAGSVSGRVTDQATGQPLAGVQVFLAGTTRGALTDAQGRYTLAGVPAGPQTLRATRVGYAQGSQSVTVSAGSSVTADFALRASTVELGALVVTATGQEQRKREIGNAVSTVQPVQGELASAQNLSELLQGKAAGVGILPNSGTAGAGSKIRIRGNASVSLDATPLLIIDGVRINNSTESTGLFTGGQATSRWDDINPEDIESIEILKGPAASALYGTAAANGVVQITTKRGRRGGAQVRAYAERTSTAYNREDIPDNFLARGRLASGQMGTCDLSARAAGTCTQVDSLYRYNPLFQGAGSPLRDGYLQKFGASLSGGSADGSVTYYVSGESEKGPGNVRFNDLDRASFRANVGGRLNESLRVTASSGFVGSYIQLPQNDNSGNGILTNALLGSPSPTNVARGQGFRSPYSASTVGWWKNEEDLRRFTGSVRADYTPFAWLSFNAVAGLDQASRFERSIVAPPGLPGGAFAEGFREQYRTQEQEITSNLNGTLTRDLSGALRSTTAAGVQYNESTFDWTYVAGENLAPGTKSAATASDVAEAYGQNKLFGVYVSQQFGIADRLFLTAALRGDQNSAFGQNIGFITYPAFSASWVLSEEPFFPQLALLSNLRLRAAYGESGVRPGRLDAVQTYTDRAVALDGGVRSGFILNRIGNPDLKPEISREVELGADLGLFDDRLGLEATYYDKTTRDALVRRPLGPSLGGPATQFFNLGEVSNRGWEGRIRAEPLRTRRASLDVGMTFFTNRNRLVALGDTAIPPIAFGAAQRHIDGYPLGGYWLGRYRYADANADGLIQRGEVTLLADSLQDDPGTELEGDGRSYQGTPFPTRELSFNADLTLFRAVRLHALVDHKGGHKLYNFTRRERCASTALAFCEDRHVPGAATLEEQAAIQARLAGLSSAGFIEDAAFWKLREVALTFTAPEHWVRRFGAADALSLTLAGRNLKTWADYRGLDPEVNSPAQFDGVNDDPGRHGVIDYYTLPLARTFVLRLDLAF
mgnify:CR=1 FL=1